MCDTRVCGVGTVRGAGQALPPGAALALPPWASLRGPGTAFAAGPPTTTPARRGPSLPSAWRAPPGWSRWIPKARGPHLTSANARGRPQPPPRFRGQNLTSQGLYYFSFTVIWLKLTHTFCIFL